MDPAFWGLNLGGDAKGVGVELDDKVLNLTQVAMCLTGKEKAGTRVSLTVRTPTSSSDLTLCSLEVGRCEQARLESVFFPDDNPYFKVTGNIDVSLTGYLGLYENEDSDDDDSEEFDSEDYDNEMMMMGSDDDDDDDQDDQDDPDGLDPRDDDDDDEDVAESLASSMWAVPAPKGKITELADDKDDGDEKKNNGRKLTMKDIDAASGSDLSSDGYNFGSSGDDDDDSDGDEGDSTVQAGTKRGRNNSGSKQSATPPGKKAKSVPAAGRGLGGPNSGKASTPIGSGAKPRTPGKQQAAGTPGKKQQSATPSKKQQTPSKKQQAPQRTPGSTKSKGGKGK